MERGALDSARQGRRGAGSASPFRRWEARRRLAAREAALSGETAAAGRSGRESGEVDARESVLAPLTGEAEYSFPPGPRSPATVQTASWVFRPAEFMEAHRRRFGPCFRARLGPLRNVIFISEPAYVKAILTGDPELLRAGDINGVFRPIIGPHSILLLDGPRHLEERKLLLPPFHGKSLLGFRSLMEGAAEREVATWPAGKRFSVLPRMQEISTEIVLGAVLGVSEGGRRVRLRELLPRFLELSQASAVFIPFLRKVGGRGSWARLMRCIEELDRELLGEIRQRRERLARDEELGPDALSVLVEARYRDGSQMSDDVIRDELITLLVAGHETTSGALAFAIEEVVRHPEVMDAVRAETRTDRESYTDAVVQEALRIKPVLPIVGRKLSRPVRLGAYVLPKDAVLMPCAYLLHREPALYPEPHRFQPQRFLDHPPGTYTWIPFGGGTRRCVGANFALLQMKVVLRAILSNLELRPAAGPERVRRRSVSLAPERGGEVIAERRVG